MSSPAESSSFLVRFIDGFLQERNIKWVLTAGIAILLGSSLMMVTSNWDELGNVWRYLILLAYVGVIHGAGYWSYHHFVLRKTFICEHHQEPRCRRVFGTVRPAAEGLGRSRPAGAPSNGRFTVRLSNQIGLPTSFRHARKQPKTPLTAATVSYLGHLHRRELEGLISR